MSEVPLQSQSDIRTISNQLLLTPRSVMYKHETRSTRAQGQCMNPFRLTTPSSSPDSLDLHVSTGGLVGLPLKVHLAQTRGTLSMKRQVCKRHAKQ